MIHLSNVKFDVKDIDPCWVYSHYLNIPLEEFNGGSIKVSTPFKDEKEPSFIIYYKDGKLLFRDFSSGKSGDCFNLVQYLLEHSQGYKSSLFEAFRTILKDYNKWAMSGGVLTINKLAEKPTYKVVAHEKRLWDTSDQEYWLDYKLGSKILDWGRIHPLSFYTMSNGTEHFTIRGENIYGYFDKNGDLVKVYQPKNLGFRFTNVKKYIAGSEHERGYDTLIIASSWKDALSIWNLGIEVDIHVHNAENNNFEKSYLKDIKKRYRFIMSLLDNDDTGIKAMLKYKEEHGINYCYVPLKKDIADSVKAYGRAYTRSIVVPIINNKIEQIWQHSQTLGFQKF